MPNRTFYVVSTLLLLVCLSAHAQDKPPTGFAFRGGSRAKCSSFAILEAGVFYRAAGSAKYFGLDPALLAADLGYMRNVSDRWALGGSGHFTTSDGGPKLGVRGRARYWFTPRIGLDLMPGVFIHSFLSNEDVNGVGLNLGTSLTLGDYFSIDLYLESLSVRGYNYYFDGIQLQTVPYSGRRTGLYIGGTGRSYMAPVVAGGIVITALIVVATFNSGWD